jgi:hypothetical protein
MVEPRFKAGFTGYYGMRNFGDDLFGLICSVAAKQYWGSQPRLLGVLVPGVAVDNTMPEWYPAKLYDAPGFLAQASRFYSVVRGMFGSDVVAGEAARRLRANGSAPRSLISAFHSSGMARHIGRYPLNFGRRHTQFFTTDAAVELMPGTSSRP